MTFPFDGYPGQTGIITDIEVPGEEKTYLTIEEIITLYKLLEHEYISYENTEALELMKKLRNICDMA